MPTDSSLPPDLPPPEPGPEFPADFVPMSVRGGGAAGRLARTRDGRWWWLDAAGRLQVRCGIQGVDATVGDEPADAQAARWGFDVLVPPVAEAFVQRGAAHLRSVGLVRRLGGGICEDGVRLPDVFDPAWTEAVEQLFNAVVETPGLLGWWGDQSLRWGGWSVPGEPLRRPGLLQVCLSLDPAHRAYHAAWEFVLARYRGELSAVAAAWGVALPSRAQAREITRTEQVLDNDAYRRDLADFVSEFAQRYFTTVRRAAKAVAADRLWLSPEVDAGTPPAVLSAATSHCDLVCTRVPGITGGVAPELWWVAGWDSPARWEPLELGESQLESALRNGRRWLTTGLQHPGVVGYVWERFRHGDLRVDNPLSAGLLDEHGRENVVLTGPLSAINRSAVALRQVAAGVERG